MSSTISTPVTTTVIVGSAAYPSPLTITDTGVVAPTAVGATGVSSSLVGNALYNYGVINGGAGSGLGVELSAGKVSNSGTITGGTGSSVGGEGVSLGGGTLNNYDSITGGSGTDFGGAGAFLDGGTLNNYHNITGGYGVSFGGYGVMLSSGTLMNHGNVTGGSGSSFGGTGAFLNGGTLINSDSIAGGSGTAFSGYGVREISGTLTNNGDITGASNSGGVFAGAGVLLAGGTLTNNGDITGGTAIQGGAYGVILQAGTLTNTTTGSITGGSGGLSSNGNAGAYLEGGTLITAGTISGGAAGIAKAPGDAVRFSSSASTLVVDPGAVFNGQVAAYSSVNDTLELSGTQAGGTPITLGNQFTGFSTLDFAHDAAWTVDVGTGAASSSPGLTVEGFSVGDAIDITNLSPSQVATDFGVATYTTLPDGTVEFNGSMGGETLTTADDGTLKLTGDFSGDYFVLTPDGTTITLQPIPCYCRGTLIRTATGEKRVEDLAIGDHVLTASGEARPVRWLGHRSLECARYPDPAVVWPIRIQAGAFAQHQPARDLWVSPGHSILIDGVLIPAEKLVNGATIVQLPRERVEYWHVELDSHDILLAEGLPAESYLDSGNRTAFINGGAYLEAYPDFAPKHWRDTCVPLVFEGAALQRAKAALLARAAVFGHVMTEDPDLHVMADGKRIDPVRLGEKRLAFTLPVAGSSIELRCRRFIPAHIDPASDDQRSLGICVNRLQCDGADVALEDKVAFALGWHALESNPDGKPWRWSYDRTPLPAGTRVIVLDCWPGRYWAEPRRADFALCG